MAYIPDSTIQEILDRADIESVVGKYVSFTRSSGDNRFALCPFHTEKTGSFHISRSRQFYYCFGCKEGGNAIDFVMKMEGMSFPEAARKLAEEYGVDIPENDSYDGGAELKRKKERIYALLTEAARFYYTCFNSPEGKKAKEYAFKSRSLSNNIQVAFGLGYAPEGFSSLYDHLISKGYTEEEMKNSGLFSVSQKNGRLYDLFRGRLVFPIFDSFGRLIAFGGRTMGDDTPKYLNSPDSLVYHKQEHLYGLNFAKKSREKYLMIVEGYMDVIAMHQAGFTNTVAALGTAFTDSQLRLASKFAEEIVFFFDSDYAGKNAALRAVSMMLRYLDKMSGVKIRIKIACVPDGKDPDEYIRNNGADSFAAVVKSAKDVDRYLTDRAYEDNLDEDGQPDLYKYQQDITLYGSWIKDDVKREKMASIAAGVLRASHTTILREMDRARDEMIKQDMVRSEREIKRANEEEIRRRSETADRPAAEQEFPDDVVYSDELELFIRAVKLRGALYSNIEDKTDILRPDDFYGKNMKAVVRFFLDHFNKEYGIKESYLLYELSKTVFNGQQAESVYLRAFDTIPDGIDARAATDLYLARLYSLRIKHFDYREKVLLEKLKVSSGEEAEKIKTALRKISEKRDIVREKEEAL